MLRPISALTLALLTLSLVPSGCGGDDDDDDQSGRQGSGGAAGSAGQGAGGQGQAGQGMGSTFDCEGATCDVSASFCWTRSNRMGAGPLTLEASGCRAYPAGCNECECATASLTDEERASGCQCLTSNDQMRVECQRVTF